MVFSSVSDPYFVSVSPPVGILFPLLRRTTVSILWSSQRVIPVYLSTYPWEEYQGNGKMEGKTVHLIVDKAKRKRTIPGTVFKSRAW